MSLATLYSRALVGIQAPLVSVEVHITYGMPHFSIVGLPEAAVKESRHRVRSAIINSGFSFPHDNVTVHLAPADLPKEGARFDLAIALGIIAASGQLPSDLFKEMEFLGELALSGELRPISGALPIALATAMEKRSLFLPVNNAPEAALAEAISIYPANHLLDVCAHLTKKRCIPLFPVPENPHLSTEYPCLSDVKGQHMACKALEIAAAGKHSLLLVGSPGSGKTMLANRLAGILPPLNRQEAIEVASIHSLSTQRFSSASWQQRPFRNPHHTASSIALVGGGNPPKPGEISLAHHGILFLDELPEFERRVLECLREPLESKFIRIARAARYAEFPANFQLIAAMNPCPCGHLGNPARQCRCSPQQIQRYCMRISGPLLDRIDMHIEVLPLPKDQLIAEQPKKEASHLIRERVIAARLRQLERQDKLNSELDGGLLNKICTIDSGSRDYLTSAMEKFNLSARSYHRILRLARSIADLDASKPLEQIHLAQALQFRCLDRFARALA